MERFQAQPKWEIPVDDSRAAYVAFRKLTRRVALSELALEQPVAQNVDPQLLEKKMIRSWLISAVCLAIALVSNVVGQAQIVPFQASGSDATYLQPFIGGNGSTYSLGSGTHMGNLVGYGQALPTGVGNNWATIGDYTLTAANGDSIYMNGGGTIDVYPLGGDMYYAVWSGQFNVVGGTGRFANVGPGTAPIDVVAVNEPFTFADPVWVYSWTLSGDIDLGHANN